MSTLQLRTFSRNLGATLLVFCIATGTSRAANDTLTQYSTIGALFQRMYDGEMTFGQLRTHGGFGLGTVNGLDGELVVLDGKFYQVKADGSVHILPPGTKTPFVAVTAFAADQTHQTRASLNYETLRESVDRWIPTANFFYAIKVEGEFERITTRSVRAQTKPYQSLAAIAKTNPCSNSRTRAAPW